MTISTAINSLQSALHRGMTQRPTVGGFTYLAQALLESGVRMNIWELPSCQSLYLTDKGNIVMQGDPIISGMVDVPVFNEQALIQAIRNDQAGKTSFPEFLHATWEAGVIRYVVDLKMRKVTYYGSDDELYTEEYHQVTLKK